MVSSQLQRNYGLSKASGAYAAFLDSDDYWHRQIIEFSRYFPAKPSLLYSDLFLIRSNTQFAFLNILEFDHAHSFTHLL